MTELKNVYKSYGAQQVLSGFSLALENGSRTALMGRSGSGKTTVLNLIMSLIKPDSGEVIIKKGTRFGTVFQEDRLIEGLCAEANCRLVMKPPYDRANELLSRLGISGELLKKPAGELSGGERRRVAIARALLCDPEMIILDEPFKGIDAQTLPAVISETDIAARGKTLVLVTHSEEEALALSCKIVRVPE